MNMKDTPQSKAPAVSKSASASDTTPDPSEPQFKRVAAAGRDGRDYKDMEDADLTRLAVDRGITINDTNRDELIAAHEAYDRDGSQGADAPGDNHPETIARRAEEDAARQREAQGR